MREDDKTKFQFVIWLALNLTFSPGEKEQQSLLARFLAMSFQGRAGGA